MKFPTITDVAGISTNDSDFAGVVVDFHSTYQYMYTSINPSTNLSIHPPSTISCDQNSSYSSIYPYIKPIHHVHIHLSLHQLNHFHPPIHPYICQLAHLPTYPSIHLPHHHHLPHISLNPSTNKSKHPPSYLPTHTPMSSLNITIKYTSTNKYTYRSIHLSIHLLNTTTFHNTKKITTTNRTQLNNTQSIPQHTIQKILDLTLLHTTKLRKIHTTTVHNTQQYTKTNRT